MSDILSETEGCNLLASLFKSRGYAIARNVMFREYGVSFHIDGWDAKARVGFEFLTSEDEDHEDLTLGEFKVLMMAQQRGELSVFVIDEFEPLSAADLALAASDFLDEVASAPKRRRKAAPAVTKKQAAARKGSRPIKKVANEKKSVVKKRTTKKPSRR